MGWKSQGRTETFDTDGNYQTEVDEPWTDVWKSRIEKASKMSPDEIIMAARGAGNTQSKGPDESVASRKRRALAGCRNEPMRRGSSFPVEKDCIGQVLDGNIGFMLEVLDSP